MWIWTLDQELLNLNQVETIEVVANYGEDAVRADADDHELVADDFEIIAFLASGTEATLFQHHDEGLVYQALELLARFIGANDSADGFTQGRILSLSELMTKTGEDSKN